MIRYARKLFPNDFFGERVDNGSFGNKPYKNVSGFLERACFLKPVLMRKIRPEQGSGHSSELGRINLQALNAHPFRARVEIYGETGEMRLNVAALLVQDTERHLLDRECGSKLLPVFFRFLCKVLEAFYFA